MRTSEITDTRTSEGDGGGATMHMHICNMCKSGTLAHERLQECVTRCYDGSAHADL